jgi:hypothetical protein
VAPSRPATSRTVFSLASPASPASSFGGAGPGQLEVVVIGGQRKQRVAAGERLSGFDLSAEPGVGGAYW